MFYASKNVMRVVNTVWYGPWRIGADDGVNYGGIYANSDHNVYYCFDQVTSLFHLPNSYSFSWRWLTDGPISYGEAVQQYTCHVGGKVCEYLLAREGVNGKIIPPEWIKDDCSPANTQHHIALIVSASIGAVFILACCIGGACYYFRSRRRRYVDSSSDDRVLVLLAHTTEESGESMPSSSAASSFSSDDDSCCSDKEPHKPTYAFL